MENNSKNIEEILKKLKKILNLKEGAEKIGNMAEAEAASVKAQKLMMEYNLSISDLDGVNLNKKPPVTESGDINIHDKRTMGGKWMMKLLSAIAKNNLCDILYFTGLKNAIIFGESQNIEFVKFMFENLSTRLFNISKKEYKDYKIEQVWKGRKSVCEDTFHRKFLLGAAKGVNEKMKIEKINMMNNNPKVTDLVLVNDKAIETYMESKYNTRKSVTSTKVDDIYMNGISTGRNISFQSGLSGVENLKQKQLN